MRISLMKKLRSFRRNDDGVTLVEYGIALVLAVVVGTSTLGLLATDVTAQMDAACNVMNTSGTVGTGGC